MRGGQARRRGLELLDGDDHVGGDAEAGGGLADRLGVRRLVEAVGLLLVGGQERVHPADPDVVVDQLDAGLVELVGVELLGEVPLDHVQRHGAASLSTGGALSGSGQTLPPDLLPIMRTGDAAVMTRI